MSELGAREPIERGGVVPEPGFGGRRREGGRVRRISNGGLSVRAREPSGRERCTRSRCRPGSSSIRAGAATTRRRGRLSTTSRPPETMPTSMQSLVWGQTAVLAPSFAGEVTFDVPIADLRPRGRLSQVLRVPSRTALPRSTSTSTARSSTQESASGCRSSTSPGAAPPATGCRSPSGARRWPHALRRRGGYGSTRTRSIDCDAGRPSGARRRSTRSSRRLARRGSVDVSSTTSSLPFSTRGTRSTRTRPARRRMRRRRRSASSTPPSYAAGSGATFDHLQVQCLLRARRSPTFARRSTSSSPWGRATLRVERRVGVGAFAFDDLRGEVTLTVDELEPGRWRATLRVAEHLCTPRRSLRARRRSSARCSPRTRSCEPTVAIRLPARGGGMREREHLAGAGNACGRRGSGSGDRAPRPSADRSPEPGRVVR